MGRISHFHHLSLLVVFWLASTCVLGAEQKPAEQAVDLDPFSECQPATPYARERLDKVLDLIVYKGPSITLCRTSLVPTIVAWAKLVSWQPHPYKSWQKVPVTELRISYNPLFMRQMEAGSTNKYLLHAVIAHEVGHLIKKHVDFQNPSRGFKPTWEQNVEADYYSGHILARLGADASDLQSVQLLLYGMWEDLEHPQAMNRIKNLVQGWHDGGGEAVTPEMLDLLREIMANEVRW